jgi:hypothetical protein
MFCRLRDQGKFAVLVPLVPTGVLTAEEKRLRDAFARVPLPREEEPQ